MQVEQVVAAAVEFTVKGAWEPEPLVEMVATQIYKARLRVIR